MPLAPTPSSPLRRLAFLPLALACAGAPDPEALAPCAPPPEPSALAELAGKTGPEAGDAGRGAEVFAASCARCHAPRLIQRESRLFHDYPRLDCEITTQSPPAYLERVIAEGGLAVGRDKAMKPFADQLGSRQIADVVAYLKAGAR